MTGIVVPVRMRNQPPFTLDPKARKETLRDETWDLFVGFIGYERRSSYFLSQLGSSAETHLISAYQARQVCSFEQNLELAYSLTVDVFIETDHQFSQEFPGRLANIVGGHSSPFRPRILVDISSCSRVRLAVALRTLLQYECEIDFVYTPGEYGPPSESLTALATRGPVTPAYVGHAVGPPNASLTAILGLGYEGVEALGAWQILEPADVWLFLPRDQEGRYREKVVEENALLLEMVPPLQTVEYPVLDPLEAYRLLDEAVLGLYGQHRVVVVPLGPKVLTLAALLVSEKHERDVPVWRFSSEQFGPARDVEASGEVARLRVISHVGETQDESFRGRVPR